MSNNKLQELTEQLYSEGLNKGRQEGGKILADARAEADRIIAEAQSKAEKIIMDARKSAENISAKSMSDIKMAAGQVLASVKASISASIESKGVSHDIDEVMCDKDFVKEIIRTVAGRFSTETDSDLEIVLPESLKDGMEDYIKGEVAHSIGKGIDIATDKRMKGGFSIGPKDGGYFVSMSDGTFKELIAGYLRPTTRKILFGE